MKEFILEEQFQKALEMIGLKKDGVIDTPPHTIHLMRMGFIAGVGAALDHIVRESVGQTSEDINANINAIGRQLVAFWQQQSINLKAKSN